MSAAQLPAIYDAKLPATYVRAVEALEQCSRIDECKDWADKAEALASYARQSKDETLQRMAQRIQARAIRRCGELLKQVPPASGRQPENGGAPPRFTRSAAAREAGLSPEQKKAALRVAEVPREEFERRVESATPPTVTQLADMGRQRMVQKESERPGFVEATRAIGTLRDFAEFCGEHDPALVAQGVSRHEVKSVRRYVAAIDAWLDAFITRVEE